MFSAERSGRGGAFIGSGGKYTRSRKWAYRVRYRRVNHGGILYMDITRFINKKQREVLAKARETYGDTAQILVANEELCELAAVCAKFPRYEDKERAQEKLHKKAIDEVADVLIVLDHVINIFGLTPVEIGDRVEGKISRLNRWLSSSNSMEHTTVDREVEEAHQMSLFEASCDNCVSRVVPKCIEPCSSCGPEHKNFKKVLPCKSCVNRNKFENLKPGGVCYTCVQKDGALFEPAEEA